MKKFIYWLRNQFALLITWGIKYNLGRCQHPGCWRKGTPCYLEGYNEEPDYYYCNEHIASEGFCSICGQFWAGCESFDFSPVRGVCENCIVEFDDEFYEPKDEFDYGDYGYFEDEVEI